MVKYRFLSNDELSGLEEELKQFLITNQLYAEEWEKLNKENPEKAKEVIGLFSNMILDKVYEKTKYLLHLSEKKIKAFFFTEEKAIMIGLDYAGGDSIPKEDTMTFIQNNLSDFKIYSANKAFAKEERNQEVYNLVKVGAEKVDEIWFDFFKKLI